ncbi:MAG: hypothetical protein ABI685_13865 [Ferruginibacter sp.]
MKKTFVVLTAFTLLFFVSCQKADTTATSPTTAQTITVIPQSAVPAAVVSTFTANFSGATEVEWHKSGNLFEAEFNHTSQRHSASFDDNGHQSEHHVTCINAAVPQVVLTAFRTRNPNDNVWEWKLTNNGTWKAHFARNSVQWETTFSASGTFISEEHA